ncbi:MAG: hypothetical protein AABX54_02315 [Nanoarchaeota archaeon]
MKTSEGLAIFSQLINILIFIYFSIVLLKINALDIIGLVISAFGIIIGLITSIVSAIETKK